LTDKLMTDIETLSSRHDAAVIAIGICAFNANEIVDAIEILIDPQLAIGHRNLDTIRWWNEQEEHVREKMFSGIHTPWSACTMLAEFCNNYKNAKEIWANPPQFDLTILRTLFDECGVKFPMHYTTERDFRTLKALAHQLHIDYQSAYEGIDKHDAKDDAIAQARAVQIIERGILHG
jgi:hypothetical protein